MTRTITPVLMLISAMLLSCSHQEDEESTPKRAAAPTSPLPAGASWVCLAPSGSISFLKERYSVLARYPQGLVAGTERSGHTVYASDSPALQKRLKRVSEGREPSLLMDPDVKTLVSHLEPATGDTICIRPGPLQSPRLLRGGVRIRFSKGYMLVRAVGMAQNHYMADLAVKTLRQNVAGLVRAHPECDWKRLGRYLLVHSEVSFVYLQWAIPLDSLGGRCNQARLVSLLEDLVSWGDDKIR